LAEVVIGPAIHWMIKIISARVERDFLKPIQIEPGSREDVGIGGAQDIQSACNKALVSTHRHARAANI
jgi:hypothetical protein